MNQITATAPSGVQSDSLTDTILAALIATGASTDTIDTARETIAAGQTYSAFAVAVHDQNNQDLIPVVDCLASITRRVVDNQSLKPLLALIEQEKKDEAAAEPGHYPWCDGDITRHYDDGEPVVEHVGPRIDMPLPDDMACRGDQLLSANLGALDEFTGEPLVSYNSGGNGVLLNGPQLDQVIADLDTFVDGLRHMRHLMDMERGK
ncbi:DUF6907 domain-containing protein [Streptomyces sp. NPDC060064]|uniref:DUF6907 domain-containing protein n=1 Tax=Streptomyces sp. NPDC060064 TaxID=3347049 RepID=UPI003677DA57